MSANLTLADVTRLCKICTNQTTAWQIWNMIDREMDCEVLWAEMARVIPWAFEDPSKANSVKYPKSRQHDDGVHKIAAAGVFKAIEEIAKYEKARPAAIKRIAKIQFALREMAAILKATSKCGDNAGYLDLDIVCQSDELLKQVEELLCNDRQWENIELAKSAVCV